MRSTQLNWQPQLDRRQIKPGQLDPAHLRAVWSGECNDIYGEAAALSTLAAVLFALGRAASQADAVARAYPTLCLSHVAWREPLAASLRQGHCAAWRWFDEQRAGIADLGAWKPENFNTSETLLRAKKTP